MKFIKRCGINLRSLNGDVIEDAKTLLAAAGASLERREHPD